MDAVQNENSGIAFYNEEKRNEKAPDMSGQVNIEGKQFRIAMWNKEGKKGEFISIAFSEIEEEESAPQQSRRPSSSGNGGGGRKQYSKPSRR